MIKKGNNNEIKRTSHNQMNQKNQSSDNIPELRFPEFVNDGEWEEKKLGEIGEPLMCKRILKEQTTTNPKNGIPFYKIGTFGKEADAYIPIELFEDFKNKYSFPKNGDILISASGTIGRLVVYNGLPAYFQDSNIVWLGNDESMVLNSFLIHCYSIIKWQTSDGGIISRLYNSDLKNIKISYSKNPQERQKIAFCLSSLDEVIAANSQKLDALKTHKKGLMQNLFPQEGANVPKWRFSVFVNDGDWVEKTLGDKEVSTFVNEKISVKKLRLDSYLSTENILPDFSGITVASKLPSSGNFTKYIKGDILISNIRPYLKKVWKSDKEGGASNDVIVVRAGSKVLSEFLEFLLKNEAFINYVMKSAKGVKMPRGDKSSMQEYSVKYPNPKEQQKIADCLSSLDDLFMAQTEKIEQLKWHKKGLMQGLFPKVND